MFAKRFSAIVSHHVRYRHIYLKTVMTTLKIKPFASL